MFPETKSRETFRFDIATQMGQTGGKQIIMSLTNDV